jgi:hypothetical protein
VLAASGDALVAYFHTALLVSAAICVAAGVTSWLTVGEMKKAARDEPGRPSALSSSASADA